MKKGNLVSVFTLVIVILGLFAACGDLTEPDADTNQIDSSKPGSNQPNSSNPDPISSYTVNFNANGGTPAPTPKSIAKGGKVVIPPAMTKTGYDFGGWYSDAACTNQWDFAADTVTGNITLYAKWDVATTTSGTTLADKLAWLKTNAERDSTYVLEISTAYEELAPQTLSYTGRSNITIQLKGIGLGRVIERSSSGSGLLFTVGNGVTLLLDENLNLFGGIQINSGGNLIMNQSVKITGGSGVYVNGGTFTMNGGEISGNTASYGGGGVYVGGSVNFFEKTGGTIYGYTAGDSKSNVVKNSSDVVQNDQGHAVYVGNDNSSYIKRKETTAGTTDNLSYIGRTTPPVWDGAWDF